MILEQNKLEKDMFRKKKFISEKKLGKKLGKRFFF